MSLYSDAKAVFITGGGTTTKVLVKSGTFTSSFGGFTNTPVLANQGMAGSSQQPIEGTCEFTAAVQGGTDLEAVFNIRDGQIRVVFDTGDEWLMVKATVRDPVSLSGGSGDLSVSYFGSKWQQTKFGS